MIKVRTNKGEVELEMSGAVKEITADVAVILQAIYMGLEEENILSAISFRTNVRNLILEGLAMCHGVESENVRCPQCRSPRCVLPGARRRDLRPQRVPVVSGAGQKARGGCRCLKNAI